MDDKISMETMERIRELCRTISVAHNLDEEIRAELAAHMEDKLRAYLSGSEKLTEEDAFVLVREHFGDPDVLNGLLRETHRAEVQVSFLRKAGAAIAASSGAFIASCTFTALTFFLFFLSLGGRQLSSAERLFGNIIWANYILFVLLFLFILKKWRKEMDTGGNPWFYRLKAPAFLAILIVLSVVGKLVYEVGDKVTILAGFNVHAGILIPQSYSLSTALSLTIQLFHHFANPLHALFTLGFLCIVFFHLVWLWWFYQPRRKIVSILQGLSVWFIFIFILRVSGILATRPQETSILLPRLLTPATYTMDLIHWCIFLALFSFYILWDAVRRRKQTVPFV